MSRPNAGLFGLMQMEGSANGGRANDNNYGFTAPVQGSAVDMVIPSRNDFPPFNEHAWGSSAGMKVVEPELYPTQNFWPGGFDPTPSDSHPTQDLDAIERAMLEPTFPSLNDSGFSGESATNLDDLINQQQDMSGLNNMALSERPTPPPSHLFLGDDRISNSSWKGKDQNAKLINGEVVLRLLFKYIPKPTMEDIENIAKDTGYSFEFVIESYCQYRINPGTVHISFNQRAVVGHSRPQSRELNTKSPGVAIDSAYATQSEESIINDALPANMDARLDRDSFQEPKQPIKADAQMRPHRCAQCNQAFRRQADLKRHMKIHAPGKFQCPYVGCGKFFTRKDKLNDHWRKRHEENGFQGGTTKSRRDDSDKDPNSGGPSGPASSFPPGGTSHSSQNSANSTSSASLNRNISFSGGFTYTKDVLDTFGLKGSYDSAKTQTELSTWRVIRKLGHGGFGTVYAVSVSQRNNDQQKMVASKMINIPQDRRREVIKRVHNEISVLQLLDHPHIVKLVEVYALADRVFINTAPVADCNLTQFWSRDNVLFPVALRLTLIDRIIEVVSALDYLHSILVDAGSYVCHLDLKPANILVSLDTSSGFPSKLCICDFGSATISRSNSKIVRENRVFTHKYAAPELAGGTAEHARGQIGQKSDIWSLGCILMEAFAWITTGTLKGPESCGSRNNRNWTYRENLDVVVDWLVSLLYTQQPYDFLALDDDYINIPIDMIRLNPQRRPSAADVVKRLRVASDMGDRELTRCTGGALEDWPDQQRHHSIRQNRIAKDRIAKDRIVKDRIAKDRIARVIARWSPKKPRLRIQPAWIGAFDSNHDPNINRNKMGMGWSRKCPSPDTSSKMIAVMGMGGAGKSALIHALIHAFSSSASFRDNGSMTFYSSAIQLTVCPFVALVDTPSIDNKSCSNLHLFRRILENTETIALVTTKWGLAAANEEIFWLEPKYEITHSSCEYHKCDNCVHHKCVWLPDKDDSILGCACSSYRPGGARYQENKWAVRSQEICFLGEEKGGGPTDLLRRDRLSFVG